MCDARLRFAAPAAEVSGLCLRPARCELSARPRERHFRAGTLRGLLRVELLTLPAGGKENVINRTFKTKYPMDNDKLTVDAAKRQKTIFMKATCNR